MSQAHLEALLEAQGREQSLFPLLAHGPKLIQGLQKHEENGTACLQLGPMRDTNQNPNRSLVWRERPQNVLNHEIAMLFELLLDVGTVELDVVVCVVTAEVMLSVFVENCQVEAVVFRD